MSRRFEAESRAHAHAPAGKRPLALIVDADPLERLRLAEALAQQGLDALETNSRDAALALLGARPVALAVVGGPGAAETCEAMRASRGGRELPILVLVEPSDRDAAQRAGAAGASDFVARPVDEALLGERVRLLLRNAERSQALRRTQERLESAQRLARSGSFTVELASGAVEASLPMFELIGLAPQRGRHFRAFASQLASDDREPLLRAVRACLERDRAASLDLRVFRADGAERVLRCRLVARRDLDGEPLSLEGSVQDVTEGRRAEERMRTLTHTDELTQLGNRRLLEERLRFVLRDAQRFGVKVGVLVLDLDRLERVNDTLGPAAGDALLREVALRLLDSLEVGDGIDCRPTRSPSCAAAEASSQCWCRASRTRRHSPLSRAARSTRSRVPSGSTTTR